jgi:ERF superfamily
VLKPALNEVQLCLTFTQVPDYLIACVSDPETGASISYAYPSKSEATKAQDVGSGQTYGRRYWQVNYFNLEADDDDGNLASGVTPVTTYEAPKAAAKPTATAVKPALVGGSEQANKLKEEYTAGTLTKFSQITDRYTVSEQVKIAIKATMPKLDFNN